MQKKKAGSKSKQWPSKKEMEQGWKQFVAAQNSPSAVYQLAPKLAAIKKAAANKPIKFKLTQELAQELYSLRSRHSRPLSSDHVWLWAFEFYSGLIEAKWQLIQLEGDTNELLDGGHRLAGFIASGLKQATMKICFNEGPIAWAVTPEKAQDILNMNDPNVNRKIDKKKAVNWINVLKKGAYKEPQSSPKRQRK